MAIRVFLSFVQEDLNLVNLFRGQAKNERLDLEFDDYSLKEPYNSDNVNYIAQGITNQIRRSNIVVCLFGPHTYTSDWVRWELNKALELGKPIMGVNLYSDGRTQLMPLPLKGHAVLAWNIATIVKTMEELAQ